MEREIGWTVAAALALLVAGPAPAQAAPDGKPRISQAAMLLAAGPMRSDQPAARAEPPKAKPRILVELLLTAASDYRFRGLSQTDRKPALQAQLTITHAGGAYVQLFGSNVADYGGARVELDTALGYSRDVGPLALDGGAIFYLYPGGSGTDFVELYGSLGTAIGEGKLALSLAYAPRQANLGHRDNLYVALTGETPLPHTPLSLRGSFGVEDGAFGQGKCDWMIGADAKLLGLTFGLQYIDTARSGGDPQGKATALVSISKRM